VDYVGGSQNLLKDGFIRKQAAVRSLRSFHLLKKIKVTRRRRLTPNLRKSKKETPSEWELYESIEDNGTVDWK
jgi:hypothetical protein